MDIDNADQSVRVSSALNLMTCIFQLLSRAEIDLSLTVLTLRLTSLYLMVGPASIRPGTVIRFGHTDTPKRSSQF